MSMTEPFLPHPERESTIAAADPGAGAPPTAPGFGVEGEEPDTSSGQEREQRDARAGGAATAQDPPFRTPDPDEVRRAP